MFEVMDQEMWLAQFRKPRVDGWFFQPPRQPRKTAATPSLQPTASDSKESTDPISFVRQGKDEKCPALGLKSNEVYAFFSKDYLDHVGQLYSGESSDGSGTLLTFTFVSRDNNFHPSPWADMTRVGIVFTSSVRRILDSSSREKTD